MLIKGSRGVGLEKVVEQVVGARSEETP